MIVTALLVVIAFVVLAWFKTVASELLQQALELAGFGVARLLIAQFPENDRQDLRDGQPAVKARMDERDGSLARLAVPWGEVAGLLSHPTLRRSPSASLLKIAFLEVLALAALIEGTFVASLVMWDGPVALLTSALYVGALLALVAGMARFSRLNSRPAWRTGLRLTVWGGYGVSVTALAIGCSVTTAPMAALIAVTAIAAVAGVIWSACGGGQLAEALRIPLILVSAARSWEVAFTCGSNPREAVVISGVALFLLFAQLARRYELPVLRPSS